MRPKPVMIMILDGWGEGHICPENAISCAYPQNYMILKQQYPHTHLESSGLAVGLPAGLMGNSEVGHLNMGAGRIVYQEITRISKAIEDGEFFENREINAALTYAQEHGGTLHLLGLASDGGVHSSMDHIEALLKLAHDRGMKKVMVHAFLDGRDVPPSSALEYLGRITGYMARLGTGEIATVSGRYYAMDRDQRWERNLKAWEAMVLGRGLTAPSWEDAVKQAYARDVTDEFVEPTVITDDQGQPRGLIRDGDGIIFFNFRADRARQITRAFVDHDFQGFARPFRPEVYYVCMTQYDATIKAPVAFMPEKLNNTLGEYLAKNNMRQLRIAETEKYAHVTFFFNGGVEQPNINEDRILIPSPRIPTYDMKPEMSAFEITERVLAELDRDWYDVIILNYANPDMVGHTGNLEAAIKAIKAVDDCLHLVVNKVLSLGGVVLLTADHGNAEFMYDEVSHQCHTAHTTNLVPFILIGAQYRGRKLRKLGKLSDVAPTLLEILGLEIPKEMTGTSLLVREED